MRLNNASRLAGFARRADLPYFLRELRSTEYVHEPRPAPAREILTAHRNGGGWPEYQETFLKLLLDRRVEEALDRTLFDRSILLCSEANPEHRHRRRLVQVNREWGDIRAVHL